MSEVLIMLIYKWTYSMALNTEMPSIQGVRIEKLHCIQSCPHFRKLSSTVCRGAHFKGLE